MKRFRLLVCFLFYAVAEITMPQAPGALEAAEEAEESVHLARRTSLSRHAVARTGPEVAGAAVVRVVSRPSVIPAVARTQLSPAPVRKTPPAFAESASAPEDH
jgi:hypothetical protein